MKTSDSKTWAFKLTRTEAAKNASLVSAKSFWYELYLLSGFFILLVYWSKKLSITLITSISHGSRSPLPAASWRNFINNLGPNCGLSIEFELDTLDRLNLPTRYLYIDLNVKKHCINLNNQILGALNISLFLFPEKIFVFTALLTAFKSLSTKLLIEAK